MYSEVTNQWGPLCVLCVYAWAAEQTRRLERSPDLETVVTVETRALHQSDIYDTTKYTYQMFHELFNLCWSSATTISNKMHGWISKLYHENLNSKSHGFVCINIFSRETLIVWMMSFGYWVIDYNGEDEYCLYRQDHETAQSRPTCWMNMKKKHKIPLKLWSQSFNLAWFKKQKHTYVVNDQCGKSAPLLNTGPH